MAGRPRRTAEERLSRLLVMLPWLMEREMVPLGEVAARFDLSESEVAADLELASMCGLPPYVDELIDVFIDEGMVHVGVPRLFTRPLRLNAMEAWELVIAARSAMELPGADPHGPLGRGLAKLAAALGVDGPEGIGVDVDIHGGAHLWLEQVVAATEGSQVLRIQYWNPSREDVSERRLCPLQVFADRGNWYLVAVDAADSAAAPLRNFRVDRILELEVTGEVCERPDRQLPEPGRWFTDEAIPKVVLRLGPKGMWITERYPMVEVGEPDDRGWVQVSVAVVSFAWLERLLLRLGSAAEVVSPREIRDQVRAAAQRIMAVYDSGDRSPGGNGGRARRDR